MFEEWPNGRYHQRFIVCEFPTVDGRSVPRDALEGAGQRLLDLIAAGQTSMVLDSAGAERTARVYEPASCRVAAH